VEYVTLARIVRPHGVRGEVAAEILTDFPKRLAKLKSIYLSAEAREGASASAQKPREAKVRSCRLTTGRGGQVLWGFEGVGSMDEARRLVGMLVQVPMAERAELAAGSYYVSDLVGCEVVSVSAGGDAADAERIGVVSDVEFTGEPGGAMGTPVLVVDGAQGEVMIPLAEEMCKVDVAAKRIEVNLPEGLANLNLTK
jgi:16S rRNA processing protein RimM